ncbi:MAG TPA: gliding motility-associated ABC transporter substrate-binding protein GldG [Saprospiraceae bacterium]|nr:gliding motility-associated ABC transporter substrate-binding protein GldG [Saprospiraceae bacterium]HMQ84293.1 gliding motility-associated ABC transporter substrate-binding protein GldG [Saprospiraceae bacterium]
MIKKRNSKKAQSLLQLVLFLGILVFVNILANARLGGRAFYSSIDMTEENRFTLTPATKGLLKDLENTVFVRVLLDGEFPAGFKRLQSATQEMLDDFRSESGLIEYEFMDPSAGTTEEVNALRKELAKDNIVPVNLRLKDVDGTSEKLIYPYAIVTIKNKDVVINLLENEVPGVSPEVALNNSISLLEYKFANAIQKANTLRKPALLFTSGHGELEPLETADLEKNLRAFYETGRINLDSVVAIGQNAAALIVAKPRAPFSDKDKFKMDQYVMNGGKVLWLIDPVRMDLDSLRGREKYYPSEYDLNLDDLFFRYGFRLQSDLVLDIQCSRIPLATGYVGNAPQFDYFPYPYHLVVTTSSQHPVVKSLAATNLLYASSIDTSVQIKTGVEKTVLLHSSPNSRLQLLPVEMDFEFLRYDLDPSKFNKPSQPLALLLEGQFPSLFENRVSSEMLASLEGLGMSFKSQSDPTRMIVVSDGDMAKNKVNMAAQSYSPLGFNEFEKHLFSNKDFIINALEYLIDYRGTIEARGKEVKLRLLDSVKASEESAKWQTINIVLPLVFLTAFGFIYNWVRRRRFA